MAANEGWLAHVYQTVAVWLAEEATGTGASVQSAFRLQFPGDEVQHLAGGVMTELPLHRQGCAYREQKASLEGTAQARLAIPLVVTDGPIATFGGLLGTVTPGTKLVSTALTVSGA